MKRFSILLVFSFLLCIPSFAQKKGSFLFNVNLSDYSFAKIAKDSSFSNAIRRNEWLKPSKGSFGIGVGYWLNLSNHINLSGTLNGTFSNFEPLFVEGDTVGQAAFTGQLDVLTHITLFKQNAKINPFLSTGVGAGYFYRNVALYTPLGAGLKFNFGTASVLLQTQWRKALTKGITNDYTQYSLGFIKSNIASKEKEKNETPNLPVKEEYETKEKKKKETETKEETKKEAKPKEEAIKEEKKKKSKKKKAIVDTDEDGISDEEDGCPYIAGKLNGCPDTDEDGIADKNDQCPQIAGNKGNNGCPGEKPKPVPYEPDTLNYTVYFEFGKAELVSESVIVLNKVLSAMKMNEKITVNLGGHTDNVGSVDANYKLSYERARLCAAYLQSYGISDKRINFKGYGKERPAADINDPLVQWQNRRTEVAMHINENWGK